MATQVKNSTTKFLCEKPKDLKKSVIKYAGGKNYPAFLNKIKPLWDIAKMANPDVRLVETCSGAANVAISLKPNYALLIDINPDLIDFFNWIKTDGIVHIDFENTETWYYQARERFNTTYSKIEKSQLFYYLNKTCFNGLCRYNKNKIFNVPYGHYSKVEYRYDFSDYRYLFQNWEFLCSDFEEVTSHFRTSDFIYVDPPYDFLPSKKAFTTYAGNQFLYEDQYRLAQMVSEHKGTAVASNLATDRMVDLYKEKGFTIDYLTAPRRISANGDRNSVLEIFAVKNQIS